MERLFFEMDHSELKLCMMKYASSFFSETPVIVHAGTHFGEECIDEFSKIFPKSSRIFTFEPCLASYTFSNNRIDTHDTMGFENIKIFNLGLSDINTDAKLHLSSQCNTHSLFVKDPDKVYTHPQTEHDEEVKLVSLNTWCPENGVAYIDFISLNIEGNELKALQGASELLPNTKVIYIEVNEIEVWIGCSLFEDVNEFLEQNGFYLAMHDKRSYYHWTNMQHFRMYVNKNIVFH